MGFRSGSSLNSGKEETRYTNSRNFYPLFGCEHLNVFLTGESPRNPIFGRHMLRSMEVEYLPYKKTGYFTNLITDYLDEIKSLHPYYNRFPSKAAFKDQIEEKKAQFPDHNRQVMVEALRRQYQDFEISEATSDHIDSLEASTTFTVVTGHQLNLFTGPLYFLYKIISTINLCKQLDQAYPKYKFVPIYWMATEDHDFEEINYFNFKGQKISWNREVSGAVGRLNTEGLEEVFKVFQLAVGSSRKAAKILELFEEAYLKHQNLADATRYLANALFGEYGLVIVDGDDRRLKELMVPYVARDLKEGVSYNEVMETIQAWEDLPNRYTVQVNPREVNYFYLKEGLRERIVLDGEGFAVNNTDLKFSKEEMFAELDEHPDRFSPNVITRPLYQEVVLPNLCYIGGGGEIAYWLELKEAFEKHHVPFPILLLRNSVLIGTPKQIKRLSKLNLSTEDIFLKQNTLINKKIREISNINIDLSPQKEHLRQQFEDLFNIAELTDPSFMGAVKAQQAKQIKGLENLEKRLLKAQKRKLKDQVIRMTDLQNELFPNQSLQERVLNFSELYLEYGEELIPMLMESLKPLELQFTLLNTGD